MIGQLIGTVSNKAPEGVMVDVAGVGYEVLCPLTVIDQLPPKGQTVRLSIHTHVREDQISLFGFNDPDQRRLFRLLIGINGIGPKIGLACLSGMDSDALTEAIGAGDVRRLTTIPGLGKRTAERLILELQDKVGRRTGVTAPSGGQQMLSDLESALKNLGFKGKDVDTLISELSLQASEMTFESLLREALKRLRPN